MHSVDVVCLCIGCIIISLLRELKVRKDLWPETSCWRSTRRLTLRYCFHCLTICLVWHNCYLLTEGAGDYLDGYFLSGILPIYYVF